MSSFTNHACSIYREEWATGKGRGGEGEKERKEKDEILTASKNETSG